MSKDRCFVYKSFLEKESKNEIRNNAATFIWDNK